MSRRKTKKTRKRRSIPRGHHRGIIGGIYPGKPHRKRRKRGGKRRSGGKHLRYSKCALCHRPIFGGAKGMGTHYRRNHRGKTIRGTF